MNTKARISNAERFGRRIGGMWRGFVRRERQVAGWLVAHGLSAGAATALLWGVKLAVLACCCMSRSGWRCCSDLQLLLPGWHVNPIKMSQKSGRLVNRPNTKTTLAIIRPCTTMPLIRVMQTRVMTMSDALRYGLAFYLSFPDAIPDAFPPA